MVKFGVRVRTCDSGCMSNFIKNYLKDIPLLGKIHTKSYQFWHTIYAISGLLAYIFKATMVKFSMKVWTWDSLLHAKFCKNHLRGYIPLGQVYTKNYHF